MNEALATVGVVVIGRNEGERLKRCFSSVAGSWPRVYVDSASEDDSVAAAHGAGFDVVELTGPQRFTAARARNAGLARLLHNHPDLGFVQMVDGDCEVRPGWIICGLTALSAEPTIALVFGRRRERFPDGSIYNAFCDEEWNVPIGDTCVAGGDILCRVSALRAVSGYQEDMIAGEDPDLARRLSLAGWKLRRLDAEMTLHDAAILRFSQWARRVERAGHAFAELAMRHPDQSEPDWRKHCRSIVFWGILLPAAATVFVVMGALLDQTFFASALVLLSLWFVNIARITIAKRRSGTAWRLALISGTFLMIGKTLEGLGLLRFHLNRILQRRSSLIEYKGPRQA